MIRVVYEEEKTLRILRQSDNRPLARYNHGWENNIKMGLKEKGWAYLDFNHMVQDRKK
jgi:hypothetical protein